MSEILEKSGDFLRGKKEGTLILLNKYQFANIIQLFNMDSVICNVLQLCIIEQSKVCLSVHQCLLNSTCAK